MLERYKFYMQRLIKPDMPACAMCSMGGVGSTALARHIGSIADKTIREHAYSPELYDRTGNLRLGYMFGNPYNSVLSVFRRGYQSMHARAMNANSPTRPVKLRGITLEEYLEGEVDYFRMERQFDNWVGNVNPTHPTILIKYESLGANIGNVLGFFGSSKEFSVKSRNSSWQDQPPHIRRGLERIYGSLYEKVEAMPGIRILLPQGSRTAMPAEMSSPLWRNENSMLERVE
jgi:hypothetical protein